MVFLHFSYHCQCCIVGILDIRDDLVVEECRRGQEGHAQGNEETGCDQEQLTAEADEEERAKDLATEANQAENDRRQILENIR